MAARSAGDFLTGLARELGIGCSPEAVRSVLLSACGGRLDVRGRDGARASGITSSGIPFEASVTGGRGQHSPIIRYLTETTTWEPDFTVRLRAYLATVAELVRRLPGGDDAVTDLLHSFVNTVYPDPAAIEPGRRLAMWFGIVHHPAEPDRLAGLKVYLSPAARADVVDAVRRRWPGFDGLSPVAQNDELFRWAGLAIEVDSRATVKYKIYLKARTTNVGVPMKMARHFGEAAWEALAELARCGADAADLHNDQYFVCCTRDADGHPSYTISVMTRRDTDPTDLIHELAFRHHGSTAAVDAMARAARSCRATWRYSAYGLGFSPDYGIDKLNVYGMPTWENAPEPAELRTSRPLV
ncbi:hypothetical protein [Nocardia nova]|uniref:hypothetical protein n=1 Tax=Nocardia nova TaxID=37330 RepID=UPI0011DDD23C|nr:hypothetical protein [Nocardia nova]